MSISVLVVPVVWIFKSLSYVLVFRARKIEATFLSCLIIAGAPFLPSVIPLPLPGLVSIIAGIALAVYLTMRYTGVQLIPDGLFIPLGVETLFRIGVWVIQDLL
jgi:hypothetical protein